MTNRFVTTIKLAMKGLCLSAKRIVIGCAVVSFLHITTMQADNLNPTNFYYLSDSHCMLRLKTNDRFLLLPIEEREDMAHVKVIKNGQVVKEFNCRLSADKTDYYVPLSLQGYGNDLLLDITFNNTADRRTKSPMKDFACWNQLKTSTTFDTTNREKFRPAYHHTPLWGWMNDPNGMFYKDGVWHLYFQHNPYGSQWENMTWGHSTSTDLINWTFEGEAVEPDALGTVFSGSSVVDKDNTAGFGAGAIVAMYTSAGRSQTQSLAYSTDGGKTFTKYALNPVITSTVPDFRDPHIFWNKDINRWNLILAAGQQMNIYSSPNLKDWTYESSFGEGYGNHDGVWECPDLLRMTVPTATRPNSEDKSQTTDAKATNEKWVLICNINPGGPYGGSATQYFIGTFDGHKFVCEDSPEETKWMDWGKDHYATVTFDNAPDGRHVAMAWMSNWQYANTVPTLQYRSANSIARDLALFDYQGESYCSVKASRETMAAFSTKAVSKLLPACRVDVELKNNTSIVLANSKGEQVTMTYNGKDETFVMDRSKSGDTSFSDAFAAVTKAPTRGRLKTLQIFIDHSSIEILDADGKMAMTNLVFPTEPYNKINVEGGKYKIYPLRK